MSKLTRNPKQYYDNYTEITSQIDAAVTCASEQKALKIGETVSSSTSKLSSVSANGDEAVAELVELVQKIGSQFNTLSTLASQYGSEVEPLYEKLQTQLKDMQKQEESYKKECNNGPDNQDDKYYKTENNEKKFQKALYDADETMWNDKLDKYEIVLKGMCNNVDTIVSQLSSVGSASVSDVATSGLSLTIPNIIPFINDDMIANMQIEDYTASDGQDIGNQNGDTSLENMEYQTYVYQTNRGPTTVYYKIVPKDQLKLALAMDSNGNYTRKYPWNLASEVGAKIAINFSTFGSGRNEKRIRDGGAGIRYDGKNLFIGSHYNCDTTLYMDKDGNMGYIDNKTFKSKKDVLPTLQNMDVKWAAKAFLPIIDDYKYVDNNTDPNIGGSSVHPRTFVGQLDNGNCIIGVCSGRVKNKEHGMTLKEVGDFVQNHATDSNGNKIKVRFLMNGDGGGSAAFVADGEKKNMSGEDRPVADIIYV